MCGTFFGPNAKEPGLQGHARIRDPEGELAFEDVEPLVLLGMDVPGRADAFGHDDLEQAVLPGGVVLADLDRLEHPEQPERLAFVGVQHVPGLGPLLRDGAHAALLPDVAMISNCP